ncbi:hypothetical protein AXF42_Ash017832 [Apostasia shenzhenica]|uniref:Retrovirus-related Pol polyprotein from transposon TNT 1-94-like beta-barrel domain-containing protein n=1 Tax=Apostasia shenzhenica TaxID=1088818 RepID=A0A2I0A3W4_9ASPA|nr:hypothetical protein AXF42_Ash017832 [Apostasia shenzhenica]
MTSDASKFSSIKFKNKGKVSFGDNSQGSIVNYGSIIVEPNLFLSKVLLVEDLKYNLFSVSQLCDNGYLVEFHSTKCIIKHIESDSTILVGSRDENVYTIDLPIATNNSVKCLMSKEEEAWVWYMLTRGSYAASWPNTWRPTDPYSISCLLTQLQVLQDS